MFDKTNACCTTGLAMMQQGCIYQTDFYQLPLPIHHL